MGTAISLLIFILAGIFTAKLLLSSRSKEPRKKESTEEEKSKQGFESLDLINDQVTQENKSRFEKARKRAIETGMPEVNLHLIPSPPKTIFGGREIIKKILPHIDKGTAIIGLHGISGIGKSALATLLAKKFHSQYRDDQFYFDLGRKDSQPLSPNEVMTLIIRKINPEVKFPKKPSDLISLYRTVLKEKKIILLLDNVTRSSDIDPLIPPDQSLLLVTSIKPFSFPGMVPVELDPLDSLDSGSMLLDISPRIGSWNNEIAKLCGNIPLALRIIGRYLAANPDVEPSNLSSQLQEEIKSLRVRGSGNLDTHLEATISLVCKKLTKESSAVLQQLLTFPNSFFAKAQAFICEDDGNEQLELLVNLGLVQHDSTQKRYSLHERIREFLKTKINNTTLSTVQKRHSTQYLTTLVLANDFYGQEKERKQRGLNLFDLEWENIKAGQNWADEHRQKDKEAMQLCYSYTEAGTMYLTMRQAPKEWIKWLESGLDASRKLEENEGEKSFLLQLGTQNIKLEQYDRAIEFLEQGLLLTRNSQDVQGEIFATDLIGKACLALGKQHEAIEHFEKELELINKTDDRAGEIHVLEILSKIYQQVGAIEKAIKLKKQELDFAKEKDDKNRQTAILENLGELHSISGQHSSAIELFEQGLTLATQIGEWVYEEKLLKRLGDIHLEHGEPENAISPYQKALAFSRMAENSAKEGTLLNLLGNACSKTNKFDQAADHHQRALTLFEKVGDRRQQGESLWHLSLALASAGKKGLAADHVKNALEIFKETNHSLTEKAKAQMVQWSAEQENTPKEEVQVSEPS